MRTIQPWSAFFSRVLLLSLMGLGIWGGNALAATKTSAGGNWNTAATWSPSGVPAAGDTVTITGGTVTVDVNVTQTAAGSVTVNNGATLNLTTTGVTVTLGALTLNSGGTATIYRQLTVLGTTNISGTINFGSTSNNVRNMTFTGAVTLNSGAVWNETTTGAAATFAFANNFTNNATTFTTQNTTHTFSGSGMTLSGASSFRSVTFTGSYTNSGTLSASTALTVTGAAIRLTNNGTITTTGTLAGTGGLTQGASSTLNISGATPTITTLTASATSNWVYYTSPATPKTPVSNTYYNLGGTGVTCPHGFTVLGSDPCAGISFTTVTMNPGSCVSTTGIGTIAWAPTPTTNVNSSDNVYATATVNGTTNYLKCTGYNFAIPTSATILGIVVNVERKSSVASRTTDGAMRLVNAGVIGTTDRSTTTVYTTTDVIEAHGGATDLWGAAWTPADINLATGNFGAAFAVRTTRSRTVTVDHMPITVTYSAPAAPDHIRIEHSGGACIGSIAPAQITLKACADAACSTLYASGNVTGINLSPTSAGYTWLPVNPTITSGVANSGITLSSTTTGTATLAITGTPTPNPINPFKCYNVKSGVLNDCALSFNTDALTFDVPNHIAGPRQVVTMTSCKGTFASTNRSVKFWSTYINPAGGTAGANTLQAQVAPGTGDAGCVTGYSALSIDSASPTSLSLAFGSGTTPQATFSLCYPDVGEVQVNTRYDGSAGNTPPDAGTVILGNDRFIAAPSYLTLSNVTPLPSPLPTDASGGVFMNAGNPFSMKVTAYNTNNAATPNFGKESEMVTLTATANMPDLTGAQTGTLTCNLTQPGTTICTDHTVDPDHLTDRTVKIGDKTNGNLTASLLYSEVGIIDLTATLASGSYLGSGLNPTSSSLNIGRFIPDHFALFDGSASLQVRSDICPTAANCPNASISDIAHDTTNGSNLLTVTDASLYSVGDVVVVVGAGTAGIDLRTTVTAIDTATDTLTLSNPAGATLADTPIFKRNSFTYMGEPMTLSFQLEARNGTNTVTHNYVGNYAKLINVTDADVTGTGSGTANNGSWGLWGTAAVLYGTAGCRAIFASASPYATTYSPSSCATQPTSGYTASTPRISVSGTPSVAWAKDVGTGVGTGVGTFTVPLVVSRANSLDGPFDWLDLGIWPQDGDGTVMNAAARNLDADATAGNERARVAAAAVRFGRLRLLNAYGSELLPSRVEFRAEYWDGNRWTTNTLDTTTTLASNNIAIGNKVSLGALVPTTPSITQFSAGAGGVGFITFPSTQAVGSFDIALDLRSGATAAQIPRATACEASPWDAAGNPTNTTGANLVYLTGMWCGSSYDRYPAARIKLGSPKAPYIYLRERY